MECGTDRPHVLPQFAESPCSPAPGKDAAVADALCGAIVGQRRITPFEGCSGSGMPLHNRRYLESSRRREQSAGGLCRAHIVDGRSATSTVQLACRRRSFSLGRITTQEDGKRLAEPWAAADQSIRPAIALGPMAGRT